MTKIQLRRKELNLKRSELSKISGVPLRTLEGWESGQRIPRDVYQLLKISKALNCTIEYLIADEAAKLLKNTPTK